MKRILRSILYALLEWLGFLPFYLWADTLLLNHVFEGMLWAYFPLIYVGMALIGQVFKKMSLKIGLSFFVAIALAFTVPTESIWVTMGIIVLFLISALRGLQYSQENIEGTFPSSVIWGLGLPVYFISYLLYSGAEYTYQQPMLTVAGFILAVFLLIVTNRDHLSNASLTKGKFRIIDRKLKYQNYFYIFLTLVMLFLLTRFNFVQTFFMYLMRRIFQPGDEMPIETPIETPNDELPTEFWSYSQPSSWAEFFDLVFRMLGWTAIIILIAYILYRILRKIPIIAQTIAGLAQLIAKFFTHLRVGRWAEQELSYQDETESVFDFSKNMERLRNRLRPRFNRQISWTNLNDRERARRLFKKVIEKASKQGFEFRSFETAQETISRLETDAKNDQELMNWLLNTYNRARYSNLTIEQIEALKSDLERNGWLDT